MAITYRVTVEYRSRFYWEIQPSGTRWRWNVWNASHTSELNNIVAGCSRWRWRAESQARRALAKVTNGIDFTVEQTDLTQRIAALEAELGMAK